MHLRGAEADEPAEPPARKNSARSVVCISVAFQYDEFFSMSAILIGDGSGPPMSGLKCSTHSSLKRPMLM